MQISGGQAQIFLEKQGIDAARIIAGNGADHVIVVPLIKRECADIINRRFQSDRVEAERLKSLFRRIEQSRADAVPAPAFLDINGDDVPECARRAFRNQKSQNWESFCRLLLGIISVSCQSTGCISWMFLSYNGER